jgi:glycerol uptake facilitator-like aquaporin
MSSRILLAEFLGTATLLAIVVGSAELAGQLAPDAPALALLCNTLVTGAGLLVILTALGDTGCTLNPAATLLDVGSGRLDVRSAGARVLAQMAGALAGVALVHLCFALPVLAVSTTTRAAGSPVLSEWVATTGLLFFAGRTAVVAPRQVPVVVACWVVAGYWFTSTSCFANPAVTFARLWTSTPAGIAPSSAPAFLLGQLLAVPAAALLLRASSSTNAPPKDAPPAT